MHLQLRSQVLRWENKNDRIRCGPYGRDFLVHDDLILCTPAALGMCLCWHVTTAFALPIMAAQDAAAMLPVQV